MPRSADYSGPDRRRPDAEAPSPPRDPVAVFRAVLGESSLPMAATEDASHVVRYANPAFCRFVRREDEDVVGHPLPAVLGDTEVHETVALMDRVYAAGGAASVAVFRGTGSQPAVHAIYAAWAVRAERDQPAGLLLQVMDTTDQSLVARAAEELREVNRRLLQAGLDAEVRAETHVALNAALQESEKRLHLALDEQARLLASEQEARSRAEVALRVRDEFLGMAAHELRSPLTAIKGAAQMVTRALARGALDPTLTERSFGMIAESSDRLERMLSDLLDVSRMRAEGLSTRLAPMDMAALVSAVAGRHAEGADRHRIVHDVEAAQIQGDVGSLERVVENLLSNALKYSPNGGEVVIQLRRVSDGVLLTVHDSGIGIPAGEEERIFEPFRRAANAVKHDLPGVGLGLHISRQIAEAHGGTLRAESQGEGSGTTLILWLPAPKGWSES